MQSDQPATNGSVPRTLVYRGGGGARRQPRPSETDTQYVQFVRRWWWLLLIGAVLGTAGSFAYLKYGPTSYQSVSTVAVSEDALRAQTVVSGSDKRPPKINLVAGSYAAQTMSPQILELVGQALPNRPELTPAVLESMAASKAIFSKAQAGTNQFNITVTAGEPGLAKTLANTIASVTIKSASDQAQRYAADRQRQLELQMDSARQQLGPGDQWDKLDQTSQRLEDQLQGQKDKLFQLQSQYNLFLLQKAQDASIARNAAGDQGHASSGDQGRLSPEQQNEVQSLIQAASQTHRDSLQVIDSRRQDTEQAIADVSDRLGAANDALAALPVSIDPAELSRRLADAQAAEDRAKSVADQRRDLQQQARDLARSLDSERARLSQLQLQYQQEVQRQADEALRLRMQKGVEGVPSSIGMANVQALQAMKAQQAEAQKSIDDLTARQNQVQDALRKLPSDADGVSAGQQMIRAEQAQRDRDGLETQRKQLVQNQQALQKQLSDLQKQWSDLQLNYQQELRAMVDDDRRALVSTPAVAPAPAVAMPTVAQPSAPDQTGSVASKVDVREQYLQLISDQEKQVEASIGDLTKQLADSRAALARRPSGQDAQVAVATSRVYTLQLESLSRDYLRLRQNVEVAANPLVLVNDASDPQASNSVKKVVPMGVGLGLLLGLLPAGLLEWLRRRRGRREARNSLGPGGDSVEPISGPGVWAGRRGLVREAEMARMRMRHSRPATVPASEQTPS